MSAMWMKKFPKFSMLLSIRALDHVVSCGSFLTVVCLSVTSLTVDLWQYYVCCIRSGVTLCTHFMMLYLYHMRVTRGALVAHRYCYVPPSLQNFHSPLSASVERSCRHCIRWCRTVGFKSWANDFLLT